MTNESVKRKNLSEEVAARIKSYIIEHSLRPGDRLPTEMELADLFGVSRVIIREATKALGFLGILTSAPKRGLSVGEVDMKRVTEYLGFHFALADYPREKLLKTRIVIETGAVMEVIEKMKRDPRIYERLCEICTRLEQAGDDMDAFIRLDVEFHRTLVEASEIDPLIAFNDLLEVFFQRFRRQIMEVRSQEKASAMGHRRILEALQAGDLARAQDLVRQHMAHYRGTE